MYNQGILTYVCLIVFALAFYLWIAYTKSGKKWLNGEE